MRSFHVPFLSGPEGQLYGAYLTAVSQADQVYVGAVLDAAATRQTEIDAARVTAESDAAQLYADYQGTVAQATATYRSFVAQQVQPLDVAFRAAGVAALDLNLMPPTVKPDPNADEHARRGEH